MASTQIAHTPQPEAIGDVEKIEIPEYAAGITLFDDYDDDDAEGEDKDSELEAFEIQSGGLFDDPLKDSAGIAYPVLSGDPLKVTEIVLDDAGSSSALARLKLTRELTKIKPDMAALGNGAANSLKRLRRVKEILKNRFGAQFCGGVLKGDRKYGDATWHVPASTNLEKLYELLS